MESGLTTEATLIRVIDGDTYEFEIRRTFHVRLRGMDCPEINTPEGVRAKNIAENAMRTGKKIFIFTPANDPVRLLDFNSFGRIVADVYVDGRPLADILMENGCQKQSRN